jgi:hypothetical protein
LKKVHRNLIGHEFLQKGESDLTQQLWVFNGWLRNRR